MDDKRLVTDESVNPGASSGVLDSAGNRSPADSSVLPTADYLPENPVTNQVITTDTENTFGDQKRLHRLSIPFSRQKANLISALIVVIVIVMTAATLAYQSRRNDAAAPTVESTIPTQDIDLKQATENKLPPELEGAEESLLVNGDVIIKGELRTSNNSFLTSLRTMDITENRVYSLPNASGVVCLDSNNCQFASEAQLAQLAVPTCL
jgi:hypothetical protein